MVKTVPKFAFREPKCKVCLIPFMSKRIDAELCSPKCRKYWSRHRSPYPSVARSLGPVGVTYNPDARTLPEWAILSRPRSPTSSL